MGIATDDGPSMLTPVALVLPCIVLVMMMMNIVVVMTTAGAPRDVNAVAVLLPAPMDDTVTIAMIDREFEMGLEAVTVVYTPGRDQTSLTTMGLRGESDEAAVPIVDLLRSSENGDMNQAEALVDTMCILLNDPASVHPLRGDLTLRIVTNHLRKVRTTVLLALRP